MARTATQRLADLILDQSIEEFIAAKRTQGRSWRLIARDLFTLTDGQVDVTTQTLRMWMDAATQRESGAA
jgi:hypothetical protein